MATKPTPSIRRLAISPASPGASAPAAPLDTDADGMPDDWERARGTNPTAQDHNGTTVGAATPGMSGYNNLEVYLAELAQQRLSEGPWGR